MNFLGAPKKGFTYNYDILYCAKYSEMLIHQGVRNISVLENFAYVLNEWPLL